MNTLIRIENKLIAPAEKSKLSLWRGYSDEIHSKLVRLSRSPSISPEYPDDEKLFLHPDIDRRWQDPSLRIMYTLGTIASHDIVLASWYVRDSNGTGRRNQWTRHERVYPHADMSDVIAQAAIRAAHHDFQSYAQTDAEMQDIPIKSSNC